MSTRQVFIACNCIQNFNLIISVVNKCAYYVGMNINRFFICIQSTVSGVEMMVFSVYERGSDVRVGTLYICTTWVDSSLTFYNFFVVVWGIPVCWCYTSVLVVLLRNESLQTLVSTQTCTNSLKNTTWIDSADTLIHFKHSK